MSSIEEKGQGILRSLIEKIRSIPYEHFRADANYQLPYRMPQRGPYLLSPNELDGDVGLDDTYLDSDPMDVDLEHQQAEIDGKSVPVQRFVGTTKCMQ
ncbi:hypothetical protein IFM46972_03347 [Aspergillus udagawae]|uniref:Uncharacterized protein n=1 Tax=Aspergillus udagawae TaxID=91492 RepID=A0A8H3NDD7_9EURO|nr:hypothetical protein IFM46972_03347 [Aspergillus udagawae]